MRKGWDGTYRSLKQPTGSYVWHITLTGLDGKAESHFGTITLIR